MVLRIKGGSLTFMVNGKCLINGRQYYCPSVMLITYERKFSNAVKILWNTGHLEEAGKVSESRGYFGRLNYNKTAVSPLR